MSMTLKIGAALIDLSGTLHVEDAVIPGAIEALCRYVWTVHVADVLIILRCINEPFHTLISRWFLWTLQYSYSISSISVNPYWICMHNRIHHCHYLVQKPTFYHHTDGRRLTKPLMCTVRLGENIIDDLW